MSAMEDSALSGKLPVVVITVKIMIKPKSLLLAMGDLPETERACDEVLSLPMYPELDEAKIDYVTETIACFYSEEA